MAVRPNQRTEILQHYAYAGLYDSFYYDESCRKWRKDFASTLIEAQPKNMDKLVRVKKCVNLCGKDDSLLSIAHNTFRILRGLDPYCHLVTIRYMEWSTGGDLKQKEKNLRYLLHDYEHLWHVELDRTKSNYELVIAHFTYPTLMYLIGHDG